MPRRRSRGTTTGDHRRRRRAVFARGQELTAFAEARQIPVIETIAGRANLLNGHPLNIGPVGVTGSDSANAIAEKADVIIAIGTRLQDFTTGSWTAFDKAAKLVVPQCRAARRVQAPVAAGGGRRETRDRSAGCGAGGYKDTGGLDRFRAGERKKWDAYVPAMWRTATGPTPMRRRSAWSTRCAIRATVW
jgi:3D-(3,5/4)-trihydroxycyclohexane-1,2-dione acylhydrolase (decyclizing)